MDAVECAKWRRRAERLEKLVEAGQALALVEATDELLPLLMRMAQDVTGATASSILLHDAARGVLRFTLAMNENTAGVQEILRKNLELRLGQGLAGWVAEHREPVLVRDAHTDPRFFSSADKVTGFSTTSLLCVPILHEEELLGVAQVLNPKGRASFADEDLDLLLSFAHLASVALVRSRLLESRLTELRMRAQFEAAADIQRHFLPPNPGNVGGCVIWGVTRPAATVGGDLYDFIPLDDSSWLVCVADIAGKGLPAALLMAAMWARLRSLAPQHREPVDLLQALNRDALQVMRGELFATAVLARVWPRSGQVRLALAGHLPPLVFGPERCTVISGIAGLPLGIEQDAEYQGRDLKLEPNDSLLLLTDGVTEARRVDRAFFGMERVQKVADQARAPWGPAVLGAVDAWLEGREAGDDVTAVEIRFLGDEG